MHTRRLLQLARKTCGLLGFLLISGSTVFAADKLTIEITGGLEDAIPVAIVPFAWNTMVGQAPEDIAAIVSADLARSGRFKPIKPTSMPQQPTQMSEFDLARWQAKGIEFVAIGRVQGAAAAKYQVEFELLDIWQRQKSLGPVAAQKSEQTSMLLEQRRAMIDNHSFRSYAHRIADIIYERLTGERGAFSTQIAYVAVDRSKEYPYELYVADSDGFNPQRLASSRYPLMSPVWSPDGSKLAYVSFEKERSEVIVQSVYANQRESIAAFSGINGAPSWSPDGRQLALVLSKDGNPEIYTVDVASKQFTRITQHLAIDTEPSWHPDSKTIYFTSDRGGKPQIYKVDIATRRTERVTFEGDYNAGASISPDGKQLVMVQRRGSGFNIVIQNLQTGQVQVLTRASSDQSASFAPNGRMIIYATVSGGQQMLAVVSSDGRFKARLPSTSGEVRAPSWSPFLP